MLKNQINPMPEFFDRYINLVKEENLLEAISHSKLQIENLDLNKLNSIGDKVYQPGKWTIKDIFQHMIDTERIQAYRALRFARFDTTILPGFDEQLYGDRAFAGKRSLEELIQELLLVRESSRVLFESFDAPVLQNTGICFKINMSVLALGFVIVGHQTHHLNVIKERYFPLVS